MTLPTKPRSLARSRFLSDIITTAVEGGINHWAQVSDYHWWSPQLPGGTAEHHEGLPNAYVTVHEVGDYPDDPSNVTKSIGIDDIAHALRMVATDALPPDEGVPDGMRPTILAADRTNDAALIDAGAADCLMQIAVLGKVIYG